MQKNVGFREVEAAIDEIFRRHDELGEELKKFSMTFEQFKGEASLKLNPVDWKYKSMDFAHPEKSYIIGYNIDGEPSILRNITLDLQMVRFNSNFDDVDRLRWFKSKIEQGCENLDLAYVYIMPVKKNAGKFGETKKGNEIKFDKNNSGSFAMKIGYVMDGSDLGCVSKGWVIGDTSHYAASKKSIRERGFLSNAIGMLDCLDRRFEITR